MSDFESKGQRFVALCLFGVLLFNYPILALFNVSGTFYAYRQLQNYMVFLSSTEPVVAYEPIAASAGQLRGGKLDLDLGNQTAIHAHSWTPEPPRGLQLDLVNSYLALILVPPFPREGQPGDACAFPVCYIEGTLEFPAPHVVWAPDPEVVHPPNPKDLVVIYPSISNTILTMWIVMAIVLLVSWLMVRGSKHSPSSTSYTRRRTFAGQLRAIGKTCGKARQSRA